MSMARQLHPSVSARITVWMVNDEPARVVHRGVRYRVSDTPTRLEDEMSMLTHPLELTGWRFQGTDDRGVSHMFDIRLSEDGWTLLRTYD